MITDCVPSKQISILGISASRCRCGCISVYDGESLTTYTENPVHPHEQPMEDCPTFIRKALGSECLRVVDWFRRGQNAGMK